MNGEPQLSGDDKVDAVVAELDAVDPAELDAVIAAGQLVRCRLQQRLTSLDETP